MNDEGTRKKMDPNSFNIQDSYFARLRRDKTVTTIYLVNGVKLIGRIKSFDKFSILIENNHQEQLIFKHAISTITYSRTSFHRPSYPPQAGYDRDRSSSQQSQGDYERPNKYDRSKDDNNDPMMRRSYDG